MKKLMYVSGVLTALLLALVLTGWADAGVATNNAIREGNLAYTAEDYEAALSLYTSALENSPQITALHFNAAQAAYRLGENDKAIDHFEQSGDSVDRYLSVGNIHYRTASANEGVDGGLQQYAQALDVYRAGIEKYPQNVPLKYNYELVHAKIDELSQEAEQQQEQSGQEENQDGEENESQENQENQQSQEQDQENGTEEQQDSGQEEGAGQDEAQSDQSTQQDGEEGQAASQGEEAEGMAREAVERILQMLESQEEESLKNNREVVGGNEDKNGW